MIGELVKRREDGYNYGDWCWRIRWACSYPQQVLLGWKVGWTQAPSDRWLSLKDGLPLSKAPRARADMQMWSSRRVRSHRGPRAVVFEDQAVMTSLAVAINWKVVVTVRRRKGEGLSCSGRGLGRKTAMRNTDVVCWYQVLSSREMGLPVEEMKCWEGRGGGGWWSSKRYAQSPLRGSVYLLSQAPCVPIIFSKSPEQISYCICVFTSGPLLTNS